jgi:2-hydroxy-3-oxopropionate reductase
MDLAFLGTGMMGRPMVENLLADGDSVRVWNRTMEKAPASFGLSCRAES